jgi:hypothetical protein
MPLITRQEKGSKLTIEEMDGNLTYLDNKVPYKVYTALLTQTGTDDPVATVLENTIENEMIWQRQQEGVYYLTSVNAAFLNDKTYIQPFGSWAQTANPHLILYNSNTGVNGYYTMYRGDDNIIYIETIDENGIYKDISELIGTTTLYLPEIRVYN